MNSSSLNKNNNNKDSLISTNNNIKNLLNNFKKNFHLKYSYSYNYILKNKITHIIYNEKYHLVSCFKEFLIYDDPGEFLKRFYNISESFYKIKSYCDFYEKNSKNFPNYCILPESKYMFKNIKKKQKMLDNNIDNDNKNLKNSDNSINNNKNYNIEEEYNNIFSKTFINSINNSHDQSENNSNSNK